MQARARAHRIGQTRPVVVLRLTTSRCSADYEYCSADHKYCSADYKYCSADYKYCSADYKWM